MRELKGDWRDLFNGFMLGLDLRKMFLGLFGILLTVFGPLAITCLIGDHLDKDAVKRPDTFALHDIAGSVCSSWHVIYTGTANYTPKWTVWLPYSIGFLLAVVAIWAYFGGAIARIASYEIAKDGERIETNRALRFSGRKFWSFFMSPWICVIGFLFFALCNFTGGMLGRLLDLAWIGGPIVAILLPLALLSGFIMTLIVVGTLAGYPLFSPAVAAEGTDAFDAVSRGFSYVYSRPWHYVWYQLVGAAYGIVCVAFVILFAVTLCHFGVKAGACGFDLFLVDKAPDAPAAPGAKATDAERVAWAKAMDEYRKDRAANPKKYEERYDRFQHIADCSWAMILSHEHADRKYSWTPRELFNNPDPYGRLMAVSNRIVRPDHSMSIDKLDTRFHKVAAWLVMAWLVITLGLALGYVPSYVISQQTMIYYLLRKKVDGIEMNEVYEEPEDEKLAEPMGMEKSPVPPPAPAPSPEAKPPEQKPPA